MSRTATIIGPEHHGRRMSLAEFDAAEAREGQTFELGRGVIVVHIPNRKHQAQVTEILQQLFVYRAAHRDRVHTVSGGSDCKLPIESFDSERHPDVAVYLDAPDAGTDWATWIPEIIFEVVSPGSEKRDYEEKPDEYLAFGVTQYLVVDSARELVTMHRRARGRWEVRAISAGEECPLHRMPGFNLDIKAIFDAARAIAD